MMRDFWNWLTNPDGDQVKRLLKRCVSDVRLSGQLKDLTRFSEFKRIFEQTVQQMQKDDKKSLAILSVEPQEGKTLVTSLFAYAFAEFMRERVLIVDAQTYTRSASLNLTRVFEPDETQRSEMVQSTFHLNVDLLNLSSINASSPVGVEYHVNALFESLGPEYGLVLIDTSALNLHNQNNFDPMVLAHRADASLLVLSEKSVNSASVRELKSKQMVARRQILGVIYNDGGV